VALVVCLSAALGSTLFWPRQEQEPHPAGVGGQHEVEALEQALVKGDAVPLLGPAGPPKYYRFSTEKARPPLDCASNQVFTVEASAITLLQLLPHVSVARYRITAEVWHQGGEDGAVGLYFAHQEQQGAQGPEHGFAVLWLTERGRKPHQANLSLYLGVEVGQRPSLNNQHSELLRIGLAPNPQGPSWRHAIVTVDSAGVEVSLDGMPPGKVETSTLEHTLGVLDTMKNHPVPQAVIPKPLPSQAALGLYVREGKAAFRNVSVIPNP
jgi:hypothetical protein